MGGKNRKRGMAEQTELGGVAMSKATRNLAGALLLFPDASLQSAWSGEQSSALEMSAMRCGLSFHQSMTYLASLPTVRIRVQRTRWCDAPPEVNLQLRSRMLYLISLPHARSTYIYVGGCPGWWVAGGRWLLVGCQNPWRQENARTIPNPESPSIYIFPASAQLRTRHTLDRVRDGTWRENGKSKRRAS